MTAELLFDTNAAIAWIEDDPGLFAALRGEHRPVVSLITLGELEFGAAKSARMVENRARLQRALVPFRRLPVTEETARVYGGLAAGLRRKGRPIPTNDIWIAALAVEHSLPLLTRDAHFREVAGLDVRVW